MQKKYQKKSDLKLKGYQATQILLLILESKDVQ